MDGYIKIFGDVKITGSTKWACVVVGGITAKCSPYRGKPMSLSSMVGGAAIILLYVVPVMLVIKKNGPTPAAKAGGVFATVVLSWIGYLLFAVVARKS